MEEKDTTHNRLTLKSEEVSSAGVPCTQPRGNCRKHMRLRYVLRSMFGSIIFCSISVRAVPRKQERDALLRKSGLLSSGVASQLNSTHRNVPCIRAGGSGQECEQEGKDASQECSQERNARSTHP